MIYRKLLIDTPRFIYGARLWSTTTRTLTPTPAFVYEPKFSTIEQQKLLATINEANIEQLSQFNVSRQRLKNLETWKVKKGPFQSLSDILEVEGLGVKILERLCENIIANNYELMVPEIEKSTANKNSKAKRTFLTPPLPSDVFQDMKTAVGLHVDPTGISWAKYICNESLIEEWDYHYFNNLPKKMLPTETFDLAVQILNQIPVGDVYIFEATPNISPQQNNTSIAVSFNQQQELISMLLAMINTSPMHNSSLNNENGISYQNKVYFLRSKLPARLFKTLVGNEKVSATSIVNTLIDNSDDFNLSCNRVNFNEKLKVMYNSKSAIHRDILGQSLLLAISFVNLCVIKNPVSIKAISNFKKNM